MSKKTFSGGLDSLLGMSQEGKGRPIQPQSSIKEGTKSGEVRATFIVSEELLWKFKAIAYWDRLLLKDLTNSTLAEAIRVYEDVNGPIQPIPEKHK